LNWNWSIGAGSSTSNNLVFTNTFGLGSSEKMRITSAGALAFNGATNYGTVGQALISNGSGAAPTWGVSATSYSATYLVVGGGGSGGSGGGGAGGFLTGTTTLYKGTVYQAIVGQGGAASYTAGFGQNGQASQFGTIVAAGGGAGGGDGGGSFTGGSSGGSGCNGGASPGPAAAISGQGNSGGTNTASGGAGGGGGAGGAGGNGTTGSGGTGGAGLASSITGSSVIYAGGGGGGNRPYVSSGAGSGGSGGGGAGSGSYPATTPGGCYGSSGVNGLGGGGGGGCGYANTTTSPQFSMGGAGGSGVVILSIPTASYSGTYTGNPTITTSGSNTILQFLYSGSYTA
jgi:hypothetical protein